MDSGYSPLFVVNVITSRAFSRNPIRVRLGKLRTERDVRDRASKADETGDAEDRACRVTDLPPMNSPRQVTKGSKGSQAHPGLHESAVDGGTDRRSCPVPPRPDRAGGQE